MTKILSPASILEEIANFIAGGPSREELLRFRPSARMVARAEKLLAKSKKNSLSDEEKTELDEVIFAEHLIRLAKAMVRSRKVDKP